METAILTVDLLFGDSGKGKIVDALAEKYGATLVVRYNGGSQAAHNVVRNGVHHTFAQFGSAGLIPGVVDTYLSEFMLIDPLNLFTEAEVLKSKTGRDPFNGFYIYPTALVITPYHKALNRMKEIARGDAKHGSCGAGIGECVDYSIQMADYALHVKHLNDPVRVRAKLEVMRDYCLRELNKFLAPIEDLTFVSSNKAFMDEFNLLKDDSVIEALLFTYNDFYHKSCVLETEESEFLTEKELFDAHKVVIFEGAQGALLHQDVLPPYNTWSDTSLENAHAILAGLGYTGKEITIGICRTYATRHGAGPFVSEIVRQAGGPVTQKFFDKLAARKLELERHNTINDWQGSWRVGYLDIPALEYGIKIAGKIDYLAVTYVDALEDTNWVTEAYLDTRLSNVWRPSTSSLSPALITEKMLHSRGINSSYSRKNLLEFISSVLQIPIAVTSHGAESDKTTHLIDLV